MKKLGLGLGAIILAAAIYYFTVGSAQITEEIKSQVNTQLTSLGKEGFSVQDRKIEEEKEHFILSFDDPKKISTFLYRQGMQITAEDTELLKGLKLGVDVHYLPDTYSSVAFDMYPIVLPEFFRNSKDEEDKKILAQVQKILDKKAILVHVAISKTTSGFKGHVLDINETIKTDLDINLLLKGLNFNGDIKENNIQRITQKLENISITVSNEMKVTLSDINSDYKITGETLYDYSTHYEIASLVSDVNGLEVKVTDIDVLSNSTVADNIASGTIKTTVEHIFIAGEKEPYDLENFVFEMKASNIDITAMDAMQKADLSDEKVMNDILKQLFSKGVHFEISTLSLKSIESDGEKIDGFNLDAKVTLDKDFDVLALEKNPLSAINSVNADLKFVFSKALFELISQQPQAMMALMMFQPKDENDKKVYELKLKDGKFTVNGKSIM